MKNLNKFNKSIEALPPLKEECISLLNYIYDLHKHSILILVLSDNFKSQVLGFMHRLYDEINAIDDIVPADSEEGIACYFTLNKVESFLESAGNPGDVMSVGFARITLEKIGESLLVLCSRLVELEGPVKRMRLF